MVRVWRGGESVVPDLSGQVWVSRVPWLNRRRVIRGSIAAELSTF